MYTCIGSSNKHHIYMFFSQFSKIYNQLNCLFGISKEHQMNKDSSFIHSKKNKLQPLIHSAVLAVYVQKGVNCSCHFQCGIASLVYSASLKVYLPKRVCSSYIHFRRHVNFGVGPSTNKLLIHDDLNKRSKVVFLAISMECHECSQDVLSS